MRKLGLICLVVTLSSLSAVPAMARRFGGGTPASAGPRLCQTNCATAIMPPIAASPFGITPGPLRSIWFSLDGAIGRINRQGQITTYPVPTPNANVGWMTFKSPTIPSQPSTAARRAGRSGLTGRSGSSSATPTRSDG